MDHQPLWGLMKKALLLAEAKDWRAEMSEGDRAKADKRKQMVVGWRAGKQTGR